MTEYTIVYVLCHILRTYAIFKFMGAFFNREEVNKIVEFLLCALYFIAVASAYFFINAPFITVIINLLCIFALTSCYPSKTKRKVFAVFYIYAILLLIETVAFLIINILHFEENILQIMAQIIITMLTFMTALILSKSKLLKDFYSIPLIQWIATITILLITTILSISPLIFGIQISFPLLCGILCAMFFVNIIVFYLYDELLKSAKSNLENELVLQQNFAYEKQLDIIYQSTENLTTFRHDMKNHLNSIKQLIDDNKNADAVEYISTAFNMVSAELEYSKSGNYAIDSILNFKISQGIKQGLEINTAIAIPTEINISTFDLNAILGNLMDNAIDAAIKTKTKFIIIKAYYECEVLFFEVINSFNGEVKIENGKLLSTKINYKQHGIGIQSAERAVKKYNGEIVLTYDEQLFASKAMLFNIKL